MTVLWTDSIQTETASPWGFDIAQTEHPIGTPVTPSDANGANLSRVSDPAGGGGFCIRHYVDFGGADGGRAQLGNSTQLGHTVLESQAKSAEGIWIAWEFYIPEPMVVISGVPWLSLLDMHSTTDGANRWFTNPGVQVCNPEVPGCTGNSLYFRDFPANNYSSGTSALPTSEWVKLQLHWIWSTSAVEHTLWINEVVAKTFTIATKDASPLHNEIDNYIKWYGSDNGGEWSPNPGISYTRNIQYGDAFIESEGGGGGGQRKGGGLGASGLG